jgi:hypothetical protein
VHVCQLFYYYKGYESSCLSLTTVGAVSLSEIPSSMLVGRKEYELPLCNQDHSLDDMERVERPAFLTDVTVYK